MGAAKTRIFTVYLPAFYEKKETIFEQLQPLCPDVQFTGHARLTGILDEDGKKSALQAIAEEQDNLDGLIIFGGLQDKRFTSFNLPVIMVQGIWVPGDWQKATSNSIREIKSFPPLCVTLTFVKKSLQPAFANWRGKSN